MISCVHENAAGSTRRPVCLKERFNRNWIQRVLRHVCRGRISSFRLCAVICDSNRSDSDNLFTDEGGVCSCHNEFTAEHGHHWKTGTPRLVVRQLPEAEINTGLRNIMTGLSRVVTDKV